VDNLARKVEARFAHGETAALHRKDTNATPEKAKPRAEATTAQGAGCGSWRARSIRASIDDALIADECRTASDHVVGVVGAAEAAGRRPGEAHGRAKSGHVWTDEEQLSNEQR
jgi:hypothetical protein